MPITFHDTEEIEELGYAAFLQVEAAPGGNDRFGALLFVNARGEPMEFIYNRISLLNGLLWRASDREQAAVRRLLLTLFPITTLIPKLLFCRASIVGPHLFGSAGDITLEIPVGRIATAEEAVGYAGKECHESITTSDNTGAAREIHLFWTPGKPDGTAADLFACLADRGLLLEPFERAGKGLREVYSDILGAEE